MTSFIRLNRVHTKLLVALFTLGLLFVFPKQTNAQTISRQDFKYCRAGLPEAVCYTASNGLVTAWDPRDVDFVPQLGFDQVSSIGYGFILHIDLTIQQPNGGASQTRSCDTNVISRSGGIFAGTPVFLTDADVICSNGTVMTFRPQNPGETYTIHLTSKAPGGSNTCGASPCWIVGSAPYPALNIDSTITMQNGTAPATPAPQIGARAARICITSSGDCRDRSFVDPVNYTAAYHVSVFNGAEVALTSLTLTADSITNSNNTSIASSRSAPLTSPLAPGQTATLEFPSYAYNGQTDQSTTITAAITGTYRFENDVTGNISQFQIVYQIGLQASTCDLHDDCDLDSCGPGKICRENQTVPGIWECVTDPQCDLSTNFCEAANGSPNLGGYCLYGSEPCPGTLAEGRECTRCCLGSGTPTPSGPRPSIKNPDYTGPKVTDIMSIIKPISSFLYYLGIFIGVVFMIYSGYLLMTSEGDPQKMKAAQEQLTASIFGLLFILLAAAIIRIIIVSLLGGSVSF